MPRLRLFLPGLRRGVAAAMPPALSKLLSRADWQPSSESLAHTLLAMFGLSANGALPVAALCALHDLDRPELETGWCRADPVHLRADPRLVLLLAPGPAEVEADEATQGVAALAAQLPEYAWRAGRSPERWYVQAPDLDESSAYGPAWLNGRSVTPFVSRAPSARRWRGLFNDAQMVLHSLALNDNRAARGLPALNAVWLWGSGACQHRATSKPFAVGNDLLLAGAARAAGGAWSPQLGADELIERLQREDVLLMLGAPWGAATPQKPVPGVEAFTQDLLPALWRAVGRGGFAGIELIGETDRGQLSPAGRWRLWRRASPLAPGDWHAVPDPA